MLDASKTSGNGVNNRLPGQAENRDDGYGTRNRAFDPDTENDPDALRAISPDNVFTGQMPQSHTSTAHVDITPPATHKDTEYILKEGKSKFYRKSRDDLDKLSDDELDNDEQTVDTDTASQTSVETVDTLPSKDVLNQDISK